MVSAAIYHSRRKFYCSNKSIYKDPRTIIPVPQSAIFEILNISFTGLIISTYIKWKQVYMEYMFLLIDTNFISNYREEKNPKSFNLNLVKRK